MLLAVDIGNTNIKIAVFKGKKLLLNVILDSQKESSLAYYRSALGKIFAKRKFKDADIEAVIICSVVPKLTAIFTKLMRFLLKKHPLVLGKNIFVPIKNYYKKPNQVGQDRLVNAIAALTKYGLPAIIVDFGTALTFDLVSSKSEYLGGIIVPGVEIALQALTQKASLLPRIILAKPKVFLGRETASSMQSGVVYGYSFLVEGIINKLKNTLKSSPKIIATGGKAALICGYCPSIKNIDPNLTLNGLRLIYEKLKKDTKRQK